MKSKALAEGRSIAELEEEGSELRVNQDGTFHRGSRLGMRLNNELDVLRPIFVTTLQEVRELSDTTLERINDYISVLSSRFALRLSVLVCLAVGGLYKYYSYPTSASAQNLSHILPVFLAQGYGLLFLVYGSLVGFILLTFYIRKIVLTAKNIDDIERFEALSEAATDADAWQAAATVSGSDADAADEESAADEEGVANEESTSSWNEVLGLSADATKAEIEKAWKSKITLSV